MAVHVNLLGDVEILYDGQPIELSVKKAIALLAYLVTTGRSHSRERLAALFWPESKEDVARTSLRQVTQAIRRTPLASVLVTTRTSISLRPGVTSDIQAFEAYMRHEDCHQATLALDAVARLQSAESLYRNDFLHDFTISGSPAWDDWQQFRRIEYQYQITCVLAALTRYYAQQNLPDSGIKMAMRWLDMDPHNDEAHYLVMHLYMLKGQAERAIEQYQTLDHLLRRDYNRSPETRLTQLYEQIKNRQYQPKSAGSLHHSPIRTLLPRPLPNQHIHEDVLDDLRKTLVLPHNNPPFLVSVYDAQGQTVSAVIATLAHDPETQATFPDGILWGTCDDKDDFEILLRLWLDAMRISILKSTRKIEHLAWQFHNGQRGRRMLFLLENLPDARYASLIKPGYIGCTLLVTTQKRAVADALAHETGAHLTVTASP